MQSLNVPVVFYLDSWENEACLSSFLSLFSIITFTLWVNFKQIQQRQMFPAEPFSVCLMEKGVWVDKRNPLATALIQPFSDIKESTFMHSLQTQSFRKPDIDPDAEVLLHINKWSSWKPYNSLGCVDTGHFQSTWHGEMCLCLQELCRLTSPMKQFENAGGPFTLECLS